MDCTVEITDLNGTRHAVRVDANTLYEAAAKGVGLLKQGPIQLDIFPLMELTVKVRPPETLHVLRYEKLLAWLKSIGPPAEQGAKERLRKLVEE